MLHPAIEKRLVSPEIGLGLFATGPIPRGTILWALDRFDRVFSVEQVRAMPELIRTVVERYSYVDKSGAWVFCWDDARFMNHSCDATTISVGNGFEIAVRDVEPGEHVTCDYGLLNMTGGFECRCGAHNCRGLISAANAEQFIAEWDARSQRAFDAALTVEQPVLPYAYPCAEDQILVEALRARRHVELPSTRNLLRPGMWRQQSAGNDRPWSTT